jgi:hypothetical protein
MQFTLEMEFMKYSFVKHSQGIFGLIHTNGLE